ncbi:MAG: hypothetical protein K2Q23_08350 [Bryobacteraceae bacterium]|nr:hypothetical protein [Bryobacteraceae bacterium]
MRTLILTLLSTALLLPAADAPTAKIAQILYFKAKPGQYEAYNRYIREIADPIDAAARQAGAFVSLTTLLNPDPAAPWSHLRLFTFTSREQLAAFSRKMDEAGARVFPDEKQRQANAARSAALRDRVGEPLILEILPESH